MLTVCIVEDQKADQDTLRSYFDKFAKETGKIFSLSFFADGESFLATLKKGVYDLVLMDIELGGGKKNGLEISSSFRQIDDSATLIFMTNLAQYAIDGYKVNASDYCVKPISYWDFKARISSAVSRLEKSHKTHVLINAEGNKRILEVSSIYYIEVDNHLLVFHTLEGNFSTYGSLKETVKEFEGLDFAKCNSCFFVNLAYVQKVEGYDCTVAGNRLLISHPRKKEFLDTLNKYLGQI